METFLSTNKKVCVIVTSVLIPWNDSPFDYKGLRSVFSVDERIAQTIETLESIKKYLPDANVIFVEGGADDRVVDLLERHIRKTHGSRIIYGGKCGWVKRAVSGKSKALGEIALMLYVRRFFRKNRYDYFFKLSGRYKLNDDFDISRWRMDKICGSDIYGDETTISTRLLGIPRSLLDRYYYALLRRIWRVPKVSTVLEGYVAKGIGRNNICFMQPIGVEGFSASEKKKNCLIKE